MASASSGIKIRKGPGNEFLEKALSKTHARRVVCLTTKFVIDFWHLFDGSLMGFILSGQSKRNNYGNRQ